MESGPGYYDVRPYLSIHAMLVDRYGYVSHSSTASPSHTEEGVARQQLAVFGYKTNIFPRHIPGTTQSPCSLAAPHLTARQRHSADADTHTRTCMRCNNRMASPRYPSCETGPDLTNATRAPEHQTWGKGPRSARDPTDTCMHSTQLAAHPTWRHRISSRPVLHVVVLFVFVFVFVFVSVSV
ncbi:hypothetical protein B0T24DRAFT_268131 [Lasiosphaeria ovina]|uniref:Uncharacterized protein n=1 Tax=Lasiosphaeria ovina TaxID=92902 RepID=A0AAE0KBJ2_9PEZI|nr:hypothetical protein B0T24DRAFT_268131 [Lasiosphaeria ovina]